MSTLYIYHEVDISLLYTLMLFFFSFLPESRPMTSYHAICHVTAVTCLVIIKKKVKVKVKKKSKENR